MSFQTYSETIDWLFSQFPSYQNIGGKAYKPGLDNIHELLNHFGNPEQSLRFIHVAGTNGKGSTSSMLASILTESGQKVGLFTSPHIQDIRERIRVNGQMADEQFVVDAVNQIKDANLSFEPSFFEITFLMALLYFQQQACTICVIETGLGGRLDATNAITPILSLITNISLEHTQFLGNTLQAIAAEKAGIIKPGIPVIIGERQAASEQVFLAKAQECGSTITFAADRNVTLPDNFPLLGSYQEANFRLVDAALQTIGSTVTVTQAHIQAGIANLSRNTGFYGRMQVMEHAPRVIFDVSHNEAGIAATLQYFNDENPIHIVYGTSADKDMNAIFPLFSAHHHYYFTEFSSERSAKIEQLKDFSQQFELSAHYFKNPKEALENAKATANKEDTILVFGSFFLIADFF